jgi:DNA repair exonuclease
MFTATQVLCEQPPVVYPGSIERVDFSEEKEDKGFVLVELARKHTRFEFCPLPVRPFRTIEVDLSEAEDPQDTLLSALRPEIVRDAVVRLVYYLRSEQLEQIDTSFLHEALNLAHSYTIHPELVSQLARPRLPELGVGHSIAPLDALKTYLANREDLREFEGEMLEVAQRLLLDEQAVWLELAETEAGDSDSTSNLATVEDGNTQLRLL